MHTVAVVALPDVIAFDLATAVEVFGRVTLPSGGAGYRVLVCGTDPVVTAGPLRIATDHRADALATADTIVIPGRDNATAETPGGLLAALRSAYDAGTRIASICTGAFTLAEAGLLDGSARPLTGLPPTCSAPPTPPWISIPMFSMSTRVRC